MTRHDSAAAANSSGIVDSVAVALVREDGTEALLVKGPDKAVWGDRPVNTDDQLAYLDENVKGPDPKVWGSRDDADRSE